MLPIINQHTILSQCAFFRGLTPTEITLVQQAAVTVQAAQGSFFFQQGEEATALYVILSGQVRLSQINPEGRQVIVHIFGPGEAMGVIVVLSNMTYPVSAEAMVDSAALAWNRETINYLMEKIPHLALNGLRLVAQRFMELQERYRELATERVERRIARALIRQMQRGNGRAVPLTRQDLAEMTGTTLYTVSRTCSAWEQAGIVSAGRGLITINDYHRLLIIAEDLTVDHQCPQPATCFYCSPILNCDHFALKRET